MQTTRNVKWVAALGQQTCGSPVVSGGRVFIGTTGTASRSESVLLCLDEKTGKLLGTFVHSKKGSGYGICSTPTIESDRLYFVSDLQEVICLDLKVLLGGTSDSGQATGGDDKNLEEISAKSILWSYDLKKLHSYQDHAASSSVLVHGEFVYVCTGNGRFKTKDKPYFPLTPSLIAFNKNTGQLVARDDEQIGEQLYRGQWSSPSLGMVNGKVQIIFATGNGYCYGFEPVDPEAKVKPDGLVETKLRGPIVYYIDVTGTDTGGLTPAEYAAAHDPLPSTQKPALPLEYRFSLHMPVTTPVDSVPTAQVPDVPILKKIWCFDCIPQEYKRLPFYAQGDPKGDGRGHPCDIIATPVFYKDRVYVSIGGDPCHGSRNNKGCLVCINASKRGDVTQSAKVWSYDNLMCSITAVAVANGLVFVADEKRVIHCLDADNGKCYWTYAVPHEGDCYSSPLLVDGKLYVGKTILEAGKTLKLLGGIISQKNDAFSTHCVANGVLFAVIGNNLWAIADKGDKKQ